MAIGFRVVSAAVAASITDPATSPTIPSGTADGDLMILLVGSKATTPPTCATPSGWTAPANNTVTGGTGTAGATTGGPVRITLFTKVFATGDTDPVVDLSAAASPTLARILTYTKASTDAWDAVVCATAADTTGSTTDYTPATGSPQVDLGSGDWLGAGDMLNDDAGTATLPATMSVAGVTLGTPVNRFSSPNVAGNDGWLIAGDVPYVSGTASAGPVRSISGSGFIANFSGCTVFYRLRVLPPVEKAVPATVALATSGVARTVPETVAVQTTGRARTVTADASFGSSKERLAPADVALLASPSRVVSADVALLASPTRTVPVTAAFDGVVTRAVLATLALTWSPEQTVPATADVAPGWLRTVPSTVAVGRRIERAVPVDAAVQRLHPLVAATSTSFGRVADTSVSFAGGAA